MAAKLLILLALPLSALAAGSPCAVVPASGTTAAPVDKNAIIGASVAGGAAVATGIGLLVGYEANKKKGDTKPPTPVAPVVTPTTPVAPVAPVAPRVIGDDDKAAGSASCGTLCWVGIGLLSLCVLLGLLGLLYMACSKKKTTKKKKSKVAAPEPGFAPVEVAELAPLIPLAPLMAPMATPSYMRAPAMPVTTSRMVAAPVTTAVAAPVYETVAAPTYAMAAPMAYETVAAPTYAMAAPMAYETVAAPTYAMAAPMAYETVAAPTYAMAAPMAYEAVTAPAYAIQSVAAPQAMFGTQSYGMQPTIAMESVAPYGGVV